MNPKNNFADLARQLAEPMLITPEAYRAFLASVERLAAMGGFGDDEERLPPACTVRDGIAHISLNGLMMWRPPAWAIKHFGVCCTDRVRQAVNQAANDSQVQAVMLLVDSHGGRVTGTPELADAILACDRRKPVMSYVEGAMGSAAYFAGSQARMIVGSKSAMVGGIGTIFMLYDYSAMYKEAGIKPVPVTNRDGTEFKPTGMPGTVITPAQREYLQELADDIHAGFRLAVMRRRSPTDDAMSGKMFATARAMENGLLDEAMTMDQAEAVLRAEEKKARAGA